MINMDIVFLTLLAAIITANKTRNAPALDAKGNPQFKKAEKLKIPPSKPVPRRKTATPKLAPEEIPKTKGPARGFLNSVCINKPLTESPDPTKIAVIVLGNL